MISRLTWSGLDYPPLPHESSLSVLWRLAWWNALSFPRLKVLCKGTGSQFNNSLLLDRWMDTDYFASQTQWKLPSNIEQKIFRSIDKKPYSDVWFNSLSRICPICLEAGYHSVWHQFKPLKHCPMHHCVLQTRCQSCGTTLAGYSFSSKLLATPYQCRKCGGPISGVALDFGLHREFRTHHEELIRIFRPFADWLEKAENALSPLREVRQQHPDWPDAGASWNSTLSCWRNIGYQLHRPPASCTNPPLPRLIWNRWRIKSADLERERTYRGDLFPTRGDTDPEATAAYRSVVCWLRNWLLKTLTPAHIDAAFRAERHWSWGDPYDLWSRDPREIAYELLRLKNETGNCVNLKTRPNRANLLIGPRLYLPRYGGWVPKLVLRRTYVAIYAGLVTRIYNARRTKRIVKPYELEPEDVSLVTESWTEEPYGFSGWMAFPAVEGLSPERWLTAADRKDRYRFAKKKKPVLSQQESWKKQEALIFLEKVMLLRKLKVTR